MKNQDLSKNRYRIAVTPETAIRYRLEKTSIAFVRKIDVHVDDVPGELDAPLRFQCL